ncbi:hypothetical protein BDV11DRAFT_210638 [Aspergillus similis]
MGLLHDLPRDIWLYITDFMHPADIENTLNTNPSLWKHIFKDTSWLELALKYPKCSPLLLGHGISSFRARKPSKNIYLALIAHDWSGDLRYQKEKFFAALPDGCKYDKEKFELHYPSGLVLNIYDIVCGADCTRLPLERIFINKKGGVYSEYCHYREQHIKVLEPTDILGKTNANDLEWDQPASKGKYLEHGCLIKLQEGDTTLDWIILRRDEAPIRRTRLGEIIRHRIKW